MNNKLKKIVFIVDGGNKEGLGHVYQSISFAKLLKQYNVEICFLTKSNEIVVKKISDEEFIVHKLTNDFEIIDFIKQDRPDIVIIDKIDVSVNLAKEIKKYDKTKLVIFTNLTNANRYADIAITADINKYYKNANYIDIETNTLYFYGPKYWILREEFYEFKKIKKAIPSKINNILISFGGSDPSNLTSLVIKEILKMQFPYEVDIILGASFKYENSLKCVLEEFKSYNKNIYIYKDIRNMAELMFKADLVITSPGLSAFEALCVGTPIIAIPQDVSQQEEFQGRIVLIEKNEVSSLSDKIINMCFTYPNHDDIVNMHIGEGKEEIINAVL